MKHTKVFTILLLVLLAFSPLYASGAVEGAKDFKSLDLNTASAEEMESAWKRSIEVYNNQYSTLSDAINEAFKERNVEDYVELKALQKSLTIPVITEEETKTVVDRIEASESKEEKDALSSFLLSHSKWYSPKLTFSYSYEKNGMSRSYKKSISTAPGTLVTVPSVSGDGVFIGWSTEENGDVVYEAGDDVEMPYTDAVLYAVFSSGITFKDTVNDIDVFVEGTEAEAPVTEEKEGYVFLGWFDRRGDRLDGNVASVKSGDSREYRAIWKALEIGDAQVRYYEDGKIPYSTEVLLSFPVSNVGNTKLSNLKLTVEGDGMDVLSSSSLKVNLVGKDSSANASFAVKSTKEKGESVSLRVKIEDGDGNEWTKDFSFIVQ